MSDITQLHYEWIKSMSTEKKISNKFSNEMEFELDSNQLVKIKQFEWEKLKLDKNKWDSDLYDEAIEQDDFEFVKWLVKNKCSFGMFTFTQAVRFGNLDICKFLFTNSCPFDYLTMSNGATHSSINNDLTIIKWLKLNGCEWGGCFTQDMFIIKKNKFVCEWLKLNGCVWKNLYD